MTTGGVSPGSVGEEKTEEDEQTRRVRTRRASTMEECSVGGEAAVTSCVADVNGGQPPADQHGGGPSARKQRHLRVLEIGTIGVVVVSKLTLRELWLMRRVSRAFHQLASEELRSMAQPMVGGGLPCDVASSSVEMLSLATMQWTLSPPLPTCRSDAAVCTDVNGMLIVAGGDTLPCTEMHIERGWSVTKTTTVFNPRSLAWELDAHTAEMQTERTTLSLVRCNTGRVLAIGGCDDNEEVLASVEGLDPQAAQWQRLEPMKRPRHSFATGCLPSGQIVVAGGQDKFGNFLQFAELYDPADNTWTSLPNIPDLCRGAQAGWVREADGRFCVCGLGSTGSTVRSCYALSHSLDRWQLVWEVDFERREHDTGGSSCGACVPVRGGCLLIGGVGAGSDLPLATGDFLDEDSGKVYHLPNPLHYSRRWTYCSHGVPLIPSSARHRDS